MTSADYRKSFNSIVSESSKSPINRMKTFNLNKAQDFDIKMDESDSNTL